MKSDFIVALAEGDEKSCLGGVAKGYRVDRLTIYIYCDGTRLTRESSNSENIFSPRDT